MTRDTLNSLIVFFTFIFSFACGLFLVRVLIPLYFFIFSPFSKTLHNFYITIGVIVFILLLLDLIFFKKGKYNWGIWLTITAVLLLGFGIPIFMLENNQMLWHEAVFTKSGPVYFVDFSDDQLKILNSISDLYALIWGKVYLFVYPYIAFFIAVYIYLWREGWRYKGIRIKF
jgi:hypothetical protein